MNRSQLRNLVVEATGRTDKTDLMNTALDLAVAEVSAQHLWSDLLTSTSASIDDTVISVSLASDLARLTEVRVMETDGSPSWKLKLRTKTWLMRRYSNPSGSTDGKPYYGYLEGGTTLYFIPIPDAEYTVRYSYYKLHPSLTNDASTLEITHADQAVVAYATFWVFQSLERAKDADRWFALYSNALMSAKKVDRDNSAVEFEVDTRDEYLVQPDYWLDPYVKEIP